MRIFSILRNCKHGIIDTHVVPNRTYKRIKQLKWSSGVFHKNKLRMELITSLKSHTVA